MKYVMDKHSGSRSGGRSSSIRNRSSILSHNRKGSEKVKYCNNKVNNNVNEYNLNNKYWKIENNTKRRRRNDEFKYKK